MEIWKDVVNYEGLYKVNNFSEVKSLNYNGKKIERKLKPSINKDGYLKYILYKNTIKQTLFAHRISMIAFVENTENKPVVNHINGIKNDNNILNLEWATIKENCQHSYDNGFSFNKKGSMAFGSKLTEKDVLEIRAKGNYKPLALIAEDYGVCKMSICRVLNNKRWTHI